MSHFTRIKTQMVEKQYLLQALKDLGYVPDEGKLYVRGFGGQRSAVEIRVPARGRGHDIGFRQVEGTYEVVADWWGIRGINRQQFVQQLVQRYAYHAACAKLEEQGFTLAAEETAADGSVHLLLRRVA